MGRVNAFCRMLALLTLNERGTESAGRRLIEWAAVCKADGVILPWWPKVTSDVMDRLIAKARDATLSCYVEPQPNKPVPTSPGIDGYWISDPDDWSLKVLQDLQRTAFICIKDAKQLEPYLETLREATFLYVDCGQPPQVWFTIWQTLSRSGRRRALGYVDDRPGLMGAVERTAYAPFVVKRLTLSRRVEPAHGAALLPYEFSRLVRVARGIREQLAVIQGKRSVSPEPVARPGRPSTDRGVADIAVVIRSKNEAEWIGRTLEQIASQSRQPQDVILVDNDSTDETVAVARRVGRRLPLKIVTIRDSEFNFSRALNRGLEQVTASWAISLSAHCIPVHAHWLAAFEEETLDRELAPFLAGVYGRQEPMEGVTSDIDKRDLWTTFGAQRRVQSDQDFFFHNANSMIRKAVWERVPFDETLNGVEDRDWAQKVLRDGYSLVYTPKASVYHHHGIHHGRNESRAKRVVKVIELLQQRLPVGVSSG